MIILETRLATMVEAQLQAEEVPPEIDPLNEETIFVVDFERQWEFEYDAK